MVFKKCNSDHIHKKEPKVRIGTAMTTFTGQGNRVGKRKYWSIQRDAKMMKIIQENRNNGAVKVMNFRLRAGPVAF